MLHHLSIRNFILIDELELDFDKGLCVITGETGAGKSIILEAILFCLTAKSSILNFQDNMPIIVSASFTDVPNEVRTYLQTLDIDCSDVLVVKRIQSNKTKKFFLNDQLVVAKTIEYIADYLFEIHGQNSHSMLLNANTHINILDEFGKLQNLRQEVAALCKNIQHLHSDITRANIQKEDINKEIDYLSFVVEELLKFDIQDEEEQNLENIRHNLRSQVKKIAVITEIIHATEEYNLTNSISKVLRLIHRKDLTSAHWQNVTNHLEQAASHLELAISELEQHLNSSTLNKHDLDQVEERLFAIKDLSRKYKIPANQFENFLKETQDKLARLQNSVTQSAYLANSLNIIKKDYYEIASNLSKFRQEAADKLMNLVQASLSELQMSKAVFKVEIQQNKELISNKGIDNVRFTASINPGMPLLPIDKVASGGELSRFMLALKTAIFDKHQKPLVIFDEIDTGIGGNTAISVGKHLKHLGNKAQVLIITHQPQIACYASQHIMVHKTQLKEQTSITVQALDFDKRITEIARMISGNQITNFSLNTAQEMLQQRILFEEK